MEFDYIIVGAGSAGCVLANRLSADGRHSVALFEAGGKDSYPWIHIPVGYFKTMGNPATDWCYRTEPDPGLNGRAINWPRGKVLAEAARSTDFFMCADSRRISNSGASSAIRDGRGTT